MEQHASHENYAPPVYRQTKKIELDPGILKNNRCICIDDAFPEIEYYKIIKTQVLHEMEKNNWKTLMITSVAPGEGKTLTAINMAMTFAKSYNQTVLLIDADLKHQAIHRYLNFDSEFGLIDYLVDEKSLSDLLIWPGIDKLTIISGGRTITDSSELLGSPKMLGLVEQMKSRYSDRYIIFDVPPLIGRSDALAFSLFVDAILIVVQANKTSKYSVQDAVALIPKNKILGFVLNRLRQ